MKSCYNCKVFCKEGASNHIPDLLSRHVSPLTSIDFTSLDANSFRALQIEGPLYKEFIDYLEGRSLPKRKMPARLDEFDLIDGGLYHIKDKVSGLVSQLCISSKYRSHALDIAHSSKIAGHPGTYRTYRKLQEMYFPCALSYTRNYVSKCLTGKKLKGQ